MLATRPDHQGAGIGRQLVDFAEQVIRDAGLGTMQLELLVPKSWTHPRKEVLRDWYTRRGYRLVRTGDISEQYPALAPLLATPCSYLVFRRTLA